MSWSRDIRLSRPTLPAFMAQGILIGAFAAYVPQIKAGLGASDGAFGTVLLAMSVGAVGAMLCAPVFDRWMGRFAMPVAAGLFAMAAQGMAAAPSIVLFGCAIFAFGAFSGLLDVVMNARVASVEAAEDASLMNLNHGIFSVAYAVAAFSSGMAREWGVTPQAAFAGWMVVVWALALMSVHRPADVVAPDEATPGLPLGPAVMCGGVIVLIAFMSENATEIWSALHIERSLGGTAAEGALGPTMLGLTMAFGRLSGQALVSRFHEASVSRAGALLAAVGAVIAASAQVEWVAYLGFGILGLGVSVVGPMVFALVGRRVPKHLRSVAISRVAIIGYMGFFVGPPMMGLVSDAVGLRWSFVVVAILLGLVPLMLMALRRVSRA